MANQYINVYTGSVSVGAKDGTIVSTNSDQTSPIAVILDATNNETKYIKCAIRTEAGYKTVGNTVITLSGTNAAKWGIAADNNYTDSTASGATYGNSITISTELANTNTIFWLKAMSSSDEKPAHDQSVMLNTTAVIIAA
jgi:hypothetical protein